jgi:hypothetical protein
MGNLRYVSKDNSLYVRIQGLAMEDPMFDDSRDIS